MRCLIADDLHPSLMEILGESNLEILYKPDLEREEFKKLIKEVEILVIRSRFILDADFLSEAKRLKIIARAGAGLDGIDLDYAEINGIKVLHAAEGNADAVAEHVTGLILGLLSRIPEADRAIRSGIWDREGFRGRELKGRCVGIIGYGNMGPAVAERLTSFGCRIIAYDKYRKDWPDTFAERVDSLAIQREADIISLHLPLSKETNGMIDFQYLSECKPGVILVNTSRGSVLNLSKIESLLACGQISGLAMDVFPQEPLFKKNISPPEEISSLLKRQDVIATPHVAGWTSESYEKISQVLAQKIMKEISMMEA
jgi:D-3-phosphoglycerate dehydrogenase